MARTGQLMYFPLTRAVEEHAIQLRRNQKIKLPDAIIAASALVLDAELLTHDKTLFNVVAREKTYGSRGC